MIPLSIPLPASSVRSPDRTTVPSSARPRPPTLAQRPRPPALAQFQCRRNRQPRRRVPLLPPHNRATQPPPRNHAPDPRDRRAHASPAASRQPPAAIPLLPPHNRATVRTTAVTRSVLAARLHHAAPLAALLEYSGVIPSGPAPQAAHLPSAVPSSSSSSSKVDGLPSAAAAGDGEVSIRIQEARVTRRPRTGRPRPRTRSRLPQETTFTWEFPLHAISLCVFTYLRVIIFSAAHKGTNSMPFHKSCESNDCRVKLRIKSFKVLELLIEIPETATVGSLKKTVLEAVNAILGGGLRVGVLHHGKKVRDDSKTLMQAGIGHDDMLDNLGFSLEPNCTKNPSQLPAPEDTRFRETIDTTEPLARIAPSNSSSKHGEVDASQELALTPLTTNYQGSDHDYVHSLGSISSPDKVSTNTRAIVRVPSTAPNAGAVVPTNKSKRSLEQGQRRIRHPFSVSEVEALVLAVEKLGT